jgi:hypothetical protein
MAAAKIPIWKQGLAGFIGAALIYRVCCADHLLAFGIGMHRSVFVKKSARSNRTTSADSNRRLRLSRKVC